MCVNNSCKEGPKGSWRVQDSLEVSLVGTGMIPGGSPDSGDSQWFFASCEFEKSRPSWHKGVPDTQSWTNCQGDGVSLHGLAYAGMWS